jgi:hypothetical protein
MWPNRTRLPESVRDLEPDRVIAALVATNVNVTAAARKLRVSSSDLRRLMAVNSELLGLAIDKEERRLDRAEEILDRELASDDPRYSAAAAYFVLPNARRAAERGWRMPDVAVDVNVATGPPVRCHIQWADGTRLATIDYPAGTKIPRPLEIEHDPAMARRVDSAAEDKAAE